MATVVQQNPQEQYSEFATSSIDVEVCLLEIVTELREGLIKSLKDNGRYASGDTENAIIAEPDQKHATLEVPKYLYALQDGRKPTSQGATESDPNLFEEIKKWIIAKGLIMNPYAVTKKIHKEGYVGKPGIIDEPLSNENIDKAMEKALGDLSSLFTNAVSNSIKTK